MAQNFYRFCYTLLLALLFGDFALGQAPSIPFAQSRILFHDQVDNAQKKLWALDGNADGRLIWGANDSLNDLLTEAATWKIDTLQLQIEKDTQLTNNQQVSYLRALAELLQTFYTKFRKQQIKLSVLPPLINAWQQAYTFDRNQLSLAPVMDSNTFQVGKLLLDGIAFAQNSNLEEARQHNRLQLAREQPAQAMYVLSFMPDAAIADSLVQTAMRYNLIAVYNFAQAEASAVGQLLHQMQDTAVQLVCRLASRKNGQMLLPFFDELLAGRLQDSTIQMAVPDSLAYYRLLVKTAIAYAGRAQEGDTAAATKAMRDMLHTKAMQPFVHTINGLHNAGEAVRFKALQRMTPAELYYLIVSSEQEIYTSSYMYVYRSIWQRMPVPSADSLLQLVHFDQYKKFITLAANYNTLDNFLSRMSTTNAQKLMMQFVNNLDKGEGDNLEDAVDVANSFASISNPTLQQQLLAQISNNYDSAVANGKQRASIIYRLQKLILSSSVPGNDISLSDSLGISSVFTVPNRQLLADTGEVVVQVFFYDDPMVSGIFKGFIQSFSQAYWQVSGNEYWITIRSTKGRPVVIFANRASNVENGTDERSQQALAAHLRSKNLRPTVTIHRGHSYVTRNTIEQMSAASKIVFLGSCGGYHLIHSVLSVAPEAHIIATKQIGKTAINRPFFQLLAEKLRKGEDIEWQAFWKQLSSIAGYAGFDDYIPPYKMLGATFIKAYKKMDEASW